MQENSVKITKYSNCGIKVLKATMLQTLMRAEGECTSSLVKTSFSDRHAELVNYGDFFQGNKKRRLKSIKNKFGYSHVVQKLVMRELMELYSKKGEFSDAGYRRGKSNEDAIVMEKLTKDGYSQGKFRSTYSERKNL